jgi:hypothetical protein
MFVISFDIGLLSFLTGPGTNYTSHLPLRHRLSPASAASTARKRMGPVRLMKDHLGQIIHNQSSSKLRHRGDVRGKIFFRWQQPALTTFIWCRWERVILLIARCGSIAVTSSP